MQEEKDKVLMQSLNEELSHLKAKRFQWEKTWRELAETFTPFLLHDPFNDEYLKSSRAQIAPLIAVRTLACGMQGGLTNPSRPWFRLGLSGSQEEYTDEVKEWLFDTEERLLSAFRKSNFYKSAFLLYKHLAIYGTAALFVEEDPEMGLRCSIQDPNTYYIASSTGDRIDTFFRVISLSGKTIHEKWPKTVPQSISNQSKDTHSIVHAIVKNPEYKPKKRNAESRQYLSVYFLESGGQLLEKNGFYDFPVLCPRWESVQNHAYGLSPAMEALPDARMYQKMRIDGRKAINLEVNPPLAVYGLDNTEINTSPGQVNFFPISAAGQSAISPLYQVRSNLQALMMAEEQAIKEINQAFYTDIFRMLSTDQRAKTATEVNELVGEKMIMLSPVLDSLTDEFFQPLIGRVLGVLFRSGSLAPAPEVIEGEELKVEFISVLALAQKQSSMGSINAGVSFIANLAQLKPEALDKINTDTLIDTVVDLLGVPPKTICGSDKIAELRGEREKVMQAQEQMQSMQQGANVAATAAQAASKLPEGLAERLQELEANEHIRGE